MGKWSSLSLYTFHCLLSHTRSIPAYSSHNGLHSKQSSNSPLRGRSFWPWVQCLETVCIFLISCYQHYCNTCSILEVDSELNGRPTCWCKLWNQIIHLIYVTKNVPLSSVFVVSLPWFTSQISQWPAQAARSGCRVGTCGFFTSFKMHL